MSSACAAWGVPTLGDTMRRTPFPTPPPPPRCHPAGFAPTNEQRGRQKKKCYPGDDPGMSGSGDESQGRCGWHRKGCVGSCPVPSTAPALFGGRTPNSWCRAGLHVVERGEGSRTRGRWPRELRPSLPSALQGFTLLPAGKQRDKPDAARGFFGLLVPSVVVSRRQSPAALTHAVCPSRASWR